MKLKAEKSFNIEEGKFIFTAKKETIRDLVIFPKPPWHISNRELIQIPLFWATAIMTSKMLHRELKQKLSDEKTKWPIEAIAINFGQWENAGSYDQCHIDCHTHAQFLLNLALRNASACDDGFFWYIEKSNK